MSPSDRKADIARRMAAAREKTLWLLSHVPDELLKTRVHDFYSPVGWHFGHIGMTEEYWAVTRAMLRPPRDERLSFLFANLPENPKDNRVHLPSRDEIIEYLAATRTATMEALEQADLSSSEPMLADGFAWEFAYQHECQHQESIAELLQLIRKRLYTPWIGSRGEWRCDCENRMVPIPAGRFTMGSNAPHVYDNERDPHEVTVGAFELDLTPVTAFAWTHFMWDGGYRKRELWSDEGWAWRLSERATYPEYWAPAESKSGFCYLSPIGPRDLHPDEPVSSISWFEAEAYARWAGKRLPTEAEWEYAARFDTGTGESRRYPWGAEEPTPDRACFGMRGWQPLPVTGASMENPLGTRPDGASAFGILEMAGGVWEWTSTPFLPYPGYTAYPYDGYSKDHMDGRHFVCRGGSWATSAAILRSSFRNWYVPTYRQGFLGLRCAR